MNYISKTRVIIENTHCYTIYHKFSDYELYIHNSFDNSESFINNFVGKVRDKFVG